MFVIYIITHRLFFSSTSELSTIGVFWGTWSGLIGVDTSILGRLNSPCATISIEGLSGIIGALFTHAPGNRVEAIDRFDSNRLRITGDV